MGRSQRNVCVVGVLLVIGAGVAVLLDPGDSTPRQAHAIDQAGYRELDESSRVPAAKELPPELRRQTAIVEGTAGREVEDSEPAVPSEPAGQIHRVTGRVVDVRGAALAGMEIGHRDGSEGRRASLCISRSDGSFEADVDRMGAMLEPLGSEWITLLGAQLIRANLEKELLIVAARPTQVVGRITDPSGGALGDVALEAKIDLGAFASFPLPLDTTKKVRWLAESEPDGTYRFDSLPAISTGMRIEAKLDGYEPGVARLKLRQYQLIHEHGIVLEPIASDTHDLHGIALMSDMSPASNALIHLGSAKSTLADATGRFQLAAGDSLPVSSPLVAVLPGFQPAVISDFAEGVEQGVYGRRDLRLILGGPSLSIDGRVLHADGSPAVGMKVTVSDGTLLSPDEIPPILVEALAGGEEAVVETDGTGAFRLSGLLSRTYEVQAWDRESLLLLRSGPIVAGSEEVVLRAPKDAFFDALRGQVVNRAGDPLPGVLVIPAIIPFRVGQSYSFRAGSPVTTDANGQFLLESAPRSDSHLRLGADHVVSRMYDLSDHVPGAEPRIVVEQRFEFRFEDGRGEAAAEYIQARTADDEEVWLSTKRAGRRTSVNWVRLTDGSSHVLSVAESASQLVLVRGDEEIGRVGLELRAGEIAVVKP